MSEKIAGCCLTGRTPAPAVTENHRSSACRLHPEFSNLERSAKPLTRICYTHQPDEPKESSGLPVFAKMLAMHAKPIQGQISR